MFPIIFIVAVIVLSGCQESARATGDRRPVPVTG
ncbi:MAG: lipoprotein [Acidimicrobiia bacterium]|nr:lipoprotein [Acidimicrobiia bacterium]